MINKFSILNGAIYFSSGIFQKYLVSIPAKKYIKCFSSITRIDLWKYNGMSEENVETIIKSDSNYAPTFIDHHLLPDINFNRHCLMKNNISIPQKAINPFISYTLNPQLRNLNTDFTFVNWLFGPVKLIKNADLGKCKYAGYSLGFDSPSEFSFTDASFGKNVIGAGADMSSSVHFANEGKSILILGKGPTQGSDVTPLTAEAKYPINFTQSERRFLLSLSYNGRNSF